MVIDFQLCDTELHLLHFSKSQINDNLTEVYAAKTSVIQI